MTRDLPSAMAAIRAHAKTTYGSDDDLTCFAVATMKWLAECQDGFHHAPPLIKPADLKLDDKEPIS